MRQCGDCTLCCTLLAVRELGKSAGERCRFARFKKGCTVYNKPTMPFSCMTWNCRWIVSDDMDDQSRPDRSHLVVDIMPDYVTMIPDENAEPIKLQVVQVWCDPKHPNAHRDPAFRRYLARRGEEGIAALIRYDARKAFTIIPPALAPDGQFHELHSTSSCQERTPEEVLEFLSGAKIGVSL